MTHRISKTVQGVIARLNRKGLSLREIGRITGLWPTTIREVLKTLHEKRRDQKEAWVVRKRKTKKK